MAKKMRTRKRNSFKRNNNIRRKNTNRTRRKVSRKSSRKQHRRKRTNRRRLNMRGGDPPAAQSITLYRIDNDQGSGSGAPLSAHVVEGWSDLMWFPTGGEIMSFIGSRTAPQDTGTYTEMEAGAPSTKIHGLDALVGSPYKAEDGAGFAIHVGPAGEENDSTLDGWLHPNMIHIFPLKDIMPAGKPVASLTWNWRKYDYTLEITLMAPPGSPPDRWKFRFKDDPQRLTSATNAAKMETQAA